MYARIRAQLERQTGDDLATWNARVRAEPRLAEVAGWLRRAYEANL